MTLHRINYNTRRSMYCGPTTIAAVTGRSALEVLQRIDNMRGLEAYNAGGRLKGVRGMGMTELMAVLRGMGCTLGVQGHPEPLTLVAYVQGLQKGEGLSPGLARIVRVNRHWIAIGGGGYLLCDTFTEQPVTLNDFRRYRRSRVHETLTVRIKP